MIYKPTLRAAIFAGFILSAIPAAAVTYVEPMYTAQADPKVTQTEKEIICKITDHNVQMSIFSMLLVAKAGGGLHYGCLPDAGQVDDQIAPTGSGIRYYISATGSDANTGLSPAQAWQTLEKVYDFTRNVTNSNTAPAGSQFLFKRGDSFTGYLNVWGATSGGATLYGSFYFGAYGDATLARPAIAYRELARTGSGGGNSMVNIRPNANINGYTIKNIDFDGVQKMNIFYSGLSGGTPAINDIITVTATGAQGTIVEINSQAAANTITIQGLVCTSTNTTLLGTQPAFSNVCINSGFAITSNTGWSATAAVSGCISGNNALGGSSVNSTIMNCSWKNFTSYGGNTDCNLVTNGNAINSNCLYQDCLMTLQKGSGNGGGSGGNIQWINNSIINCGRDRVYAHGMYLIAANNFSAIRYNYIYGCSNNGLTSHGDQVFDLQISDCLVECCGNGLGLGPGGFGGNETAYRTIVERNILLNIGTLAPYTTQGGHSLGGAAQVDSIWRNNLVIGTAGKAFNFGTYNLPGYAFPQNTNCQAYHNTCYSLATVSDAVLSIGEQHSGFDQVSLNIQNNIFVSLSATQLLIYRDVQDAIPDASITMNNNLYYQPNKITSLSVGVAANWKGTNYTLAALNAFNGKEVSQLYGDPQFLNPQSTATGNNTGGRQINGNFHQAAAGKKTGASLGITSDLLKQTRYLPDNVGCYA